MYIRKLFGGRDMFYVLTVVWLYGRACQNASTVHTLVYFEVCKIKNI